VKAWRNICLSDDRRYYLRLVNSYDVYQLSQKRGKPEAEPHDLEAIDSTYWIAFPRALSACRARAKSGLRLNASRNCDAASRGSCFLVIRLPIL
jgi:hypothetical protein